MKFVKFKAFPIFQKLFCAFCRENRKVPFCIEKVRCADCPWKGKEPEDRYPGDETMKVCGCCGKNIYIPEEMNGYVYKRECYSSRDTSFTEYYCGWNCMRKMDREKERIYRLMKMPVNRNQPAIRKDKKVVNF